MVYRIPAWMGVLAVAAALQGPAAAADDVLTGIHVYGVGEIEVVPDMARVSLEARREGQDAAALKRELDEVVKAVLALTRSLDIAERDVTATAVNVYPRYVPKGHGQEVDGLIATRTIEVELNNLGRIGELINGALERGVNGIGGVHMDAQNRVELERQALDLAIDDATREAEQMATRFKVRLGLLKNATATPHTVQPLMMETKAMRGMAADASFAPGEITVRREVQATFAIRPKGDATP